MGKPKRERREPTDQWEQLELLFTSPEQPIYEQIRPVVLFGVPPQERAKEVGAAQRTLYRQVQRERSAGCAARRSIQSLADELPGSGGKALAVATNVTQVKHCSPPVCRHTSVSTS